MTAKQCFICGGECDWHYYALPSGFICYECGKKIIEHLKVVVSK